MRLPAVVLLGLLAPLIVLVAGCGGGSGQGGGYTPTLPKPYPVTSPYSTLTEPFDIVMPSGHRVYGMIRRPDPAQYPKLSFAAVVRVPGGINPGRMEALDDESKLLAGAGMVVVCFNAEGRVDSTPGSGDLKSEGDEDFNGYRNQEGLRHLVLWVMTLPYVIRQNVGIRTQSFGITMGAGCLGRHPELAVKYLVDGEGPSWSFVTCHGPRFLAGDMQKYNTVKAIFPYLATWQDSSQAAADFWSEREAINFIGGFRGRYLRLQATWDHSQPPDSPADIALYDHPGGWPGGGPAWYHNKHTDDMNAAALAGGVPWVRVNLAQQGNVPNTVYGHGNRPTYLPGLLADQPFAARAVLEMALMP